MTPRRTATDPGVIIGSAMNNDGADQGQLHRAERDGAGARDRRRDGDCGIEADDIHYVEAHGTGTPLGDSIELEGLKRASAGAGAAVPRCAIGSVKSNIGHLDAAAGIAGFIKAVLAIERGKVPPTIHLRRPNPELGSTTADSH